jgi:hypothetical protein
MNKRTLFFLSILIPFQFNISAQDTIPFNQKPENIRSFTINGFVRGGGYYDLNRGSSGPYISSGFSDFGLKIETSLPFSYKAFADIRYRYGSEFGKPVNAVNIREAFAEYGSNKLNISFGQKIIKWGRADFTNPTSRLNPQNFISRSPDREDMDMGNILAEINWSLSKIISFQFLTVPFYKPSKLIIDPVKLPENTTITQLPGLVTDQQMMSYGIRSDLHFKGIDLGVSWFEGYDPMPGIALSEFNLDMSGSSPVATTKLTVKPYLTRVAGLDFESVLGPFGIRGEAAYSAPYLSSDVNEYVPMSELKWVMGIDWSIGIWRLTGEYSGKYIPDFTDLQVDPIIGTDPDYTKLAAIIATPGFDINEYVRHQVESFNRLYNYQQKKLIHSAGVRIDSEFLYGKLLPSVFSMYNFSTKDLTIIPEIKYKPADGITIVAGAEIFKGNKGSLFDIVDDFMNTVYVAIRIDF